MSAQTISSVALKTDATTDCFHCGLQFRPGLAGKPIQVWVNGANRDMCCAGCAAVAATIVASGLADYYRHRSVPLGRPAERVPSWLRDLESYDLEGVQRSFVQTDAAGARSTELLLEGINCPACAWLVEQRLRQLPGVTLVSVNYSTQRARISWCAAETKLSTILHTVAAVGLQARPFDAVQRTALRTREKRRRLFELAVAGLGMMQVMMYAVPVYLADAGDIDPQWTTLMQWASMALTAPVVIFSARSFFSGAWRDILSWRVGMDVPIALAIAAAFAASVWATIDGHGEVYFDSVTMFVFLLLGARYLEAESRARAVEIIERLGHSPPATALRVRGFPASRETEIVASVSLQPNEVVLVESGAIIPADGCIVEGIGDVSEAVITGESLAVQKRVGDTVVGGAVNAGSPLFVQITHVGANSVLAQIVRLAGRALSEKPAAAQLADRIASHFSLAVLILTGITVLAWLPAGGDAWFRHAIAVLVVTCPCALALATPAALTAATGHLSAIGLLVTRGHTIERFARVTDIIFDKTGTLTQNQMRVSRIVAMGMAGERKIIDYAFALEQGSVHPLARAITFARQDAGVTANRAAPIAVPTTATALTHTAGQGVEGIIDGVCYRIGTAVFVGALVGLPQGTLPSSGARSHVLLGRAGEWLGWIELDDPLREDARATLEQLRRAGLRVHLVSGDLPDAVHGVARALGVADAYVRAQALPQHKLDYLAALQNEGRIVAMVGDGINDAPVLARADLSIAMGGGTDLARANADAILLSGRLVSLVEAIQVARATRRTINQNLVWAIAYNMIAVPLAMLGWILPWLAALGMSASSLLVVVNAARLQRPASAANETPRSSRLPTA